MPITFKVSSVAPENFNPNQGSRFIPSGTKIYQNSNCKEIIASSSFDSTYNSSFSNGFVGTLFKSYCSHHNLKIRPDDVWISILTQFSLYVEANSEELRTKFVNFDGKKELTIRGFGTLRTANYEKLTLEMIDLVSKNLISEEIVQWLQPSFSTTTPTDQLVGSVIIMSSMQKYFDYKMCLSCGIPEITLDGNIDDWKKLRSKVLELTKYNTKDNLMDKWVKLLDPIMEKFIQTSEGNPDINWWGQMCNYYSGGSGPSYLSGWLSSFVVFNKNGKWQATKFNDDYRGIKNSPWALIDTSDIVPGYVSVPLKIDDNGTEHEAIMLGGMLGLNTKSGEIIEPCAGWFIAIK